MNSPALNVSVTLTSLGPRREPELEVFKTVQALSSDCVFFIVVFFFNVTYQSQTHFYVRHQSSNDLFVVLFFLHFNFVLSPCFAYF